MANENVTKITDPAIAEAVIAHEAVDCFVGEQAEESVQPTELISCTGGCFWGNPEEKWPTSADGLPLFPWLQIVCTEMEDLRGVFYRKRSVCFYLRQDFTWCEASSTFDGSDFVVREYGLSDELSPLIRPKEIKDHSFHRITWKKVSDYPSISKYHGLFDSAAFDALCLKNRFEYENRSGIKIGGWPTPIQQDQQYPGSYDLQIDMTRNFAYSDSGIAYLSRSGNHWYVYFGNRSQGG